MAEHACAGEPGPQRGELEALQRQCALFERAVRDMATGLAILDRNLVYLKVNERYARYFNRSVSDFEGRSVWEVLPGSEPYVKALLDKTIRDGQEICMEEYRVVYTDERGTHETYWDFSYAPLLDDEGRPDGLVALAQEVSERVQRRQALERNQERLEHQREFLTAILDEMEEGIVACDAAGVLRIVNQAKRQFHSVPIQAADFRHWPALYHLHHPDGSPMQPEETPLYRAWQGEHLRGFEMLILAEQAAPRLVSVNGRPLLDPDGRKLGAVVVQSDITEQRVLERMKDEFIAIVSHELKTPLSSVRAPLTLLASEKLKLEEPAGREMLEIAMRNVERMVRLVNDIVDIQRLSSGELRMRPQPCDAAELVRQAVEVMRPIAEQSGVRLHVEAAPLPLVADPTRLVQVLTNMLDNALSFSKAGQAIWVGVARDGEQALFSVRDEGPGVPPEKRELIFERFKQGDPSLTRRKAGTGLGLAIARAIVERHHGHIWVEGPAGGGAMFCFSVPLAP